MAMHTPPGPHPKGSHPNRGAARRRREGQQRAGEERAEYLATLTSAERIARLDRRLGKGAGARKERARLTK